MKARYKIAAAARAALPGGLGGLCKLCGLGALGLLAQAASAQVSPAQGTSAQVTSAQGASTQATSNVERGEAVYEYWCAPCHAPGPGHPGTQSLEIKYKGSLPAALEERTDLTPELVKVFVRQGVLLMAPFRKTEITDAELDELAAYLSTKK